MRNKGDVVGSSAMAAFFGRDGISSTLQTSIQKTTQATLEKDKQRKQKLNLTGIEEEFLNILKIEEE